MSVVAQRIQQNPASFDFVQAVRILLTIAQHRSLKLSFVSDPMPHGAPADITNIEQQSNVMQVRVGLEALSGCKGVIPDYLYCEMMQSLHRDDESLQRFLDVFNQRYFDLLAYLESTSSLILREEREQALSSALERLTQANALKHLFALPQRNGHRNDASTLRYGLLLSSKTRSMTELTRLLSDYFQLDISVSAMPATVYLIGSRYQTRLGSMCGQNNKLGHGVLLGKKGTQAYKTLEVYITPSSQKEYLGLLSDRHFAQAVRSLMNTYLRESVSSKLYLYVKREFIDPPMLSVSQKTFRLGEANCLAPKRRAEDYRKILLQSETL